MGNKFKVGDRVRTIKGTILLPIGIEATIERIGAGDEYTIKFKDDRGNFHTLFYTEEYFEPTHKSPIVEETITVKKIAAGDYGNLAVYSRGCEEPTFTTLRIEMATSVHTPEQMRDMAKTLVEIADFIDGGRK